MTIHARLTLAFAVMGALLLIQVGVAHYMNTHDADSLAKILDSHEASNTMTRLAVEGQKMRRYEKEYFIYVDNVEKRAKYAKNLFDSHDTLKKEFLLLSTQQSPAWGPDDVARAETWDEALNVYIRGFTRVDLEVANGTINDTNSANTAIQEAKNKFKVFLNGSAEQIELKYQRAQALAAQAKTFQNRIQILLYALTIVGVAVAAATIIYVPVMISKPLTQLTRAANEMSKGKIREEIPISGPPEIRDLSESMERLRVALRGILQRLQASRPSAAVTSIGAGTATGTTTAGTHQA